MIKKFNKIISFILKSLEMIWFAILFSLSLDYFSKLSVFHDFYKYIKTKTSSLSFDI